jgi:hypothetical protein
MPGSIPLIGSQRDHREQLVACIIESGFDPFSARRERKQEQERDLVDGEAPPRGTTLPEEVDSDGASNPKPPPTENLRSRL